MAYDELSNRFTGFRGRSRNDYSQSEGGPKRFSLTDENVEKIIDEAGRARVFQRARELGWTDDTPPRWVWVQISHELLQADRNQRRDSGYDSALAPSLHKP